MKTTDIIKIEALTLSSKILEQFEWREYDKAMDTHIIGWYIDNTRNRITDPRAIYKIGGRFFKCLNMKNIAEMKERFPQIFIK